MRLIVELQITKSALLALNSPLDEQSLRQYGVMLSATQQPVNHPTHDTPLLSNASGKATENIRQKIFSIYSTTSVPLKVRSRPKHARVATTTTLPTGGDSQRPISIMVVSFLSMHEYLEQWAGSIRSR